MSAQESALFVKNAPFPIYEATIRLHQGQPAINSLTISHELPALRAQVKI